MDKVKAQAGALAQKTQETANAAQAKIDSAQAGRRADGMLRSLGLAYLAERSGRATPETSAQIDKLLADLAQHEAQHNVNLVHQASAVQQAQAGPGEYLSGSPGTGFPQAGGPAGFPQAEPATGFPQAGGPAGFPQAEPATGFPQAEPATGFPPAGGPAGFPQAEPATGFPQTAPAGFGEPVQETPQDQAQQPPGFPPAAGA